MKKIYLFDVDGTLTDPRQKINKGFAEKFLYFCNTNQVYLVTGSTLEMLEEQIPNDILYSTQGIFTCSGNEFYEVVGVQVNDSVEFDLELVYKNELEVSKALEEYLLFELKWSNWSGPRIEPHFHYRTGMLNFSICGRGVSQEVRDVYEGFSVLDGDRIRIIDYINEKFPQYECSIGGQISVDITYRGKDKRQILDHLDLVNNLVVFYGDKIDSGNDKPLADRIKAESCGYSTQIDSPKQIEKCIAFPEG
jgi:hydroxymethylpyrimidine pyrophosphatase-like HAD family hydrolase